MEKSTEEIASGEGAVVNEAGEDIAMYNEGGSVRKASAKCTHQGCTVAWNAKEKTFDCPCHGSRFNSDFSVLQGPAERPLDSLQ